MKKGDRHLEIRKRNDASCALLVKCLKCQYSTLAIALKYAICAPLSSVPFVRIKDSPTVSIGDPLARFKLGEGMAVQRAVFRNQKLKKRSIFKKKGLPVCRKKTTRVHRSFFHSSFSSLARMPPAFAWFERAPGAFLEQQK